MLTNRVLTEEQTIIRRHFLDFFESERNEEKYQRRLQQMMTQGAARLLVDMGDLLDFTPSSALGGGTEGDESGSAPLIDDWNSPSDYAGGTVSLGIRVVHRPGKYVPLLELAVHDVVLRLQPQYLKVDYRSRAVHVAFDGPVGQVRSPRELYARHLNTMVALEGIITRQSANRPRVIETVHYCPATNRFTRKEFRDQLTPMIDSAHLPTVNVMPKTDIEGNPLRTELGLSSFVDSQCAILQEAPERAPTGQLPRQVELRFDDDLVDCVKPGDRVVVVGVYMPYTSADHKTFQSIVLVNHVVNAATAKSPFTFSGPPVSSIASVAGTATPSTYSHLPQEERETLGATGEHIPRLTRPVSAIEERLLSFARHTTSMDGPSGVMRLLAKSIAPTIYGMSNEKSAVLLQLVGGVERRAHHSHVRGDINILLVGEPSTAKSQLLRFVLSISPLALSTTGKGSSGVGLTAAVAVDSYTGERSLSAGAMVLADRGILCIDEFDKMSAQDRVAMHEAMEQQTVTIAKAGIHASLNARCSVLAAANPIYGFYSVQHRLAFNVGLPESLLSRFDLTFIILDQHSSEHNRRIGNYILRNHMTAPPVGYDPEVIKTVVGGNADTSAQRSDPSARLSSSSSVLAGGGGGGVPDSFAMTFNSTGERIASVDFLRAYIQFAKMGSPKLTERSQQLVSEHYVQLRAEQQEEAGAKDGFFITARTLEAIVRLSTAHAKLRLSPAVEEEDVKVAMELLRASVHAAATATEQRAEDNREAMQGGAPAAASSATPESQGVIHRGEKRRREDGAASVALNESESGTAPTLLPRQLVDVLRAFQREQRSTVGLDEVHQRLLRYGYHQLPSHTQNTSTATSLIQEDGGENVNNHSTEGVASMGRGLTVSTLRATLTSMQGDAFIFESLDDGGDDIIQFV